MKIYGTIMEINPFHNGHKYFLNQIPKKAGDILVVVLSTTIVQRGEISVLSKDVKTKLLLDHNVDIVVELPAVHANQGGLFFAKHAINILKQFKITHLCFGSELNNLSTLEKIIEAEQVFDFAKGIHKKYLENLKSNDILGISYLQSIKDTDIIPVLVKRIENNYNDETIVNSTIQSATAIRKGIINGEKVENYLPSLSFNNINEINDEVLLNTFLTNLSNVLDNDFKIFLAEDNQLLKKMKKVINKHHISSIDELAFLTRDKNNSKYKIKRIIINTILMVKDKDYNYIDYLHVLGYTIDGGKYCKKLKNELIVTSLKNQTSHIAKTEIRASQLAERIAFFKQNLDFKQPIIK